MTQSINITQLNNIATISLEDFKAQYQQGNSIAMAYYTELAAQGQVIGNSNITNYALLARDVTTNSGVNGKLANYYSKAAANDTSNIDFSVGSDAWLQMQHELMRQDLDFRTNDVNRGLSGELNVNQTNRIHIEAFEKVNLPAEVYTLFTVTNELAKSDINLAQALFEDLIHNNGIGNNILTDALAIDILNDWNDSTDASYYQWLGNLAEAVGTLVYEEGITLTSEQFNQLINEIKNSKSYNEDVLNFVQGDDIIEFFEDGLISGNEDGNRLLNSMTVIENADGTVTVHIDKDLLLSTPDGDYFYTDVIDSTLEAAQALTDFVTDQVDAAVEWFAADDGLQLDFANWFAGNVGAIIDGDLDADEALIDFAKYVALNRLGGEVQDILNVGQAQNVLGQALTGFGLDAEQAAVLASSIQQTFQRLAVEFVSNGFELSAEQAQNVAVGAVASTFANHYAGQIFGEGTVSASAATAGVTTLAVGLANSGDYNSEDWIQLGAQVGIASAAAGIGASVTSSLAAIGSSIAPGVGTVVGAVAGIVLGKVFGGFFGGFGGFGGKKKWSEQPTYGPGEFPSPEAALATQYQVQIIDTGNGGTVQALVAVNTEGSTLIAQGITHIVGNSGDDTMVGNGTDNVMYAKGGADYMEGRDGFDAMFGEGGDDHIVGNGGDDIINTGEGSNVAFGGAGNDQIIGGAGDDQYNFTDAENDTITLEYDAQEQDYAELELIFDNVLAGDTHFTTVVLENLKKSDVVNDNFEFNEVREVA